MSAPRTASTSPVVVPPNLATAARSPATTRSVGSCSLPRSGDELVQPLVGDGATVHEHGVVLERSLQHLEEVDAPDVRVDERLEHEQRPVGPSAPPIVGAGPSSTMNRASRSMPMSLRGAAAQHREHGGVGDPRRERVASSFDLDRLVGEVALHEVVVGDHDPLDDGVVDRVLVVDQLVGDRPLGAGAWIPTSR